MFSLQRDFSCKLFMKIFDQNYYRNITLFETTLVGIHLLLSPTWLIKHIKTQSFDFLKGFTHFKISCN